MKIGRIALSISLAFILSGCAILNGFSKSSSSSHTHTGASGTGWPWDNEPKTSTGGGSGSSSQSPSSTPIMPHIYSLEINAPKTVLGVGETVQFSATAQTQDGPYEFYDARWETTNNSVVSVSYYGEVTGISIGTAYIRAESQHDSSIYDTVMVTVSQNEMVIVQVDSFDASSTYKLGNYFDNRAGIFYYYADGNITNQIGPCLTTTNSWDGAADLKIEGSVDHYHLYFVIDGLMKYINTVSDIDYHLSLDSTSSTDWSWDEEYYTFTTIVNGTKYLIERDDYYGSLFQMVDYDTASYEKVARLMIQTEKVDPESIDIVESNIRMLVGTGRTLNVKISPLGATLTNLTWTVLDNDYVYVSYKGRVSVDYNAKRGTTATIKASWGSLEGDTCTISIFSYGTYDDPLTVDETCALVDEEGATEDEIYVSGIVTSNTSYDNYWGYWESIVLSNNDGSVSSAIYATYVSADNGYDSIYTEENSLVGKRVAFHCYAKYEAGKYVLYYPSLYSVTN